MIRSIAAIILFSFVAGACKHETTCTSHPGGIPFEFRIMNGNADLLDSTGQNFTGNISIYLPCNGDEADAFIKYDPGTGYFARAVNTSYSGSENNLNPTCDQLWIKYSNGDIDTVDYDVSTRNDKGCLIYSMTNVKFNNQPAEKIDGERIYFLFRK